MARPARRGRWTGCLPRIQPRSLDPRKRIRDRRWYGADRL